MNSGQNGGLNPNMAWVFELINMASNSTFVHFFTFSSALLPDKPVFIFSSSFDPNDPEFIRRLSLVPWMTYRKWKQIPIDGFFSDVGWGCMLRSAQMMLAEALFRIESRNGSSVGSAPVRERILRSFVDSPYMPYSIHQMSRIAFERYGKRGGEWYPPTLTLLVIQELLQVQGVKALVARDGVLDASSLVPSESQRLLEAMEEAQFDPLLRSDSVGNKPVLIFIPLRLGVRSFNEESYGKALALSLRFRQSIGIVGGKPGHSLYFCGSQDDTRLVYLDPHTMQQAAPPLDLSSYQCRDPLTMPIGQVDPSLALGFLVNSFRDFLDLEASVKSLPGPAMFSILTKPVVNTDWDDHGGGGGGLGDEEEDFGFEKIDTPPPPVELSEVMDGFTKVSKKATTPSSPLTTPTKGEEFIML